MTLGGVAVTEAGRAAELVVRVNLEVSLNTLITVLPRHELLALAGPGVLQAVAGVVDAPLRETVAGPAGGEVPVSVYAGVTLQARHSRPAGTLASLVTLTPSGACSVTLAGPAGLSPPRQEVVLLAPVTLGPGPVTAALQALHPVAGLAVELLTELAPAGPAVTLAC